MVCNINEFYLSTFTLNMSDQMEVYFPWYQSERYMYDSIKITDDELMMQLVEEIKEFQRQNGCSFCVCHHIDAHYCLADEHKCRCHKIIYPDGSMGDAETYYCQAKEHRYDVPDFDDDHGLLSLIAKFQEKEQKCVCILVSHPQFCSLPDETEHICRCNKYYNHVMPLKFCRAKMHRCLCDQGYGSYPITIEYCPASKHNCCCKTHISDEQGYHVCRALKHHCMCSWGVYTEDESHPNGGYEKIMCRYDGEHQCICKTHCRTHNMIGKCYASFHDCICQSQRIKVGGYQCLYSGEHPCVCLDNFFKKPTVWKSRPCLHLTHKCICEERFQEKCQAEYHICQCNKKDYRRHLDRPCSKKGFQVLEHDCYCGQRVSCFAKKHRCTCDLEKEIRLALNRKGKPQHVTIDVIKHIREKKLDYRCTLKCERMKAFSESTEYKLPDEIVAIIFDYHSCPESTS